MWLVWSNTVQPCISTLVHRKQSHSCCQQNPMQCNAAITYHLCSVVYCMCGYVWGKSLANGCLHKICIFYFVNVCQDIHMIIAEYVLVLTFTLLIVIVDGRINLFHKMCVGIMLIKRHLNCNVCLQLLWNHSASSPILSSFCRLSLIKWSPLVFGLWGTPVYRTPHAVIMLAIHSYPKIARSNRNIISSRSYTYSYIATP